MSRTEPSTLLVSSLQSFPFGFNVNVVFQSINVTCLNTILQLTSSVRTSTVRSLYLGQETYRWRRSHGDGLGLGLGDGELAGVMQLTKI